MGISQSGRLPYSDLLASLKANADGTLQTHIPGDWLQGRTTYGGLSAALCHAAGKPLARDMPLRSAQIAFVGPTGGDVSLSAEVLRAGKSSTYVGVDLMGERGLATRAIFVFGSARPESKQIPPSLIAPQAEPPETSDRIFPENVGPAFLANFEVEMISGPVPMSSAESAEQLFWLRHRDRAAPRNVTSLLALADAPPPAALSLCSGPVNVSSMNWSIDVLTDTFNTEDDWWMARAHAETARDGYSSQNMTLWNRHGVPVMASRQTIAMFG